MILLPPRPVAFWKVTLCWGVIVQDHGGLSESRQAHPDWRIWGEDVHSVHRHRRHGSLHQTNRCVGARAGSRGLYSFIGNITNIHLHPTVMRWLLVTVVLIHPADQIFEHILNSSSQELASARKILHNIVCRRLYKCLGQTQPEKPLPDSEVCVCADPPPPPNPPPHTHKHTWPYIRWRIKCPLLSKAELEADLGRTTIETGAKAVLQRDDFVVSVSVLFFSFICVNNPD